MDDGVWWWSFARVGRSGGVFGRRWDGKDKGCKGMGRSGTERDGKGWIMNVRSTLIQTNKGPCGGCRLLWGFSCSRRHQRASLASTATRLVEPRPGPCPPPASVFTARPAAPFTPLLCSLSHTPQDANTPRQLPGAQPRAEGDARQIVRRTSRGRRQETRRMENREEEERRQEKKKKERELTH